MNPDPLPDRPSEIDPEPADTAEPSDLELPDSAEPSDLDFTDMPCTDAGGAADESSWEAFVPDDDEWDPQPEPGDFWFDDQLSVSPSLSLLV